MGVLAVADQSPAVFQCRILKLKLECIAWNGFLQLPSMIWPQYTFERGLEMHIKDGN